MYIHTIFYQVSPGAAYPLQQRGLRERLCGGQTPLRGSVHHALPEGESSVHCHTCDQPPMNEVFYECLNVTICSCPFRFKSLRTRSTSDASLSMPISRKRYTRQLVFSLTIAGCFTCIYNVYIYIHVLMRDERRKKERSKQRQTNKQGKATQHTQGSLFLEKMRLRWDSNPRHSIHRTERSTMYIYYTFSIIVLKVVL